MNGADRIAQAFLQRSRLSHDIACSFDDDLDRHRYAHLSVVHPLMKQRATLRMQEDAEQKRRDQQFPTNIAEFRAIRSKDVQVTASSTTLVSSTARYPVMLTET